MFFHNPKLYREQEVYWHTGCLQGLFICYFSEVFLGNRCMFNLEEEIRSSKGLCNLSRTSFASPWRWLMFIVLIYAFLECLKICRYSLSGRHIPYSAKNMAITVLRRGKLERTNIYVCWVFYWNKWEGIVWMQGKLWK